MSFSLFLSNVVLVDWLVKCWSFSLQFPQGFIFPFLCCGIFLPSSLFLGDTATPLMFSFFPLVFFCQWLLTRWIPFDLFQGHCSIPLALGPTNFEFSYWVPSRPILQFIISLHAYRLLLDWPNSIVNQLIGPYPFNWFIDYHLGDFFTTFSVDYHFENPFQVLIIFWHPDILSLS